MVLIEWREEYCTGVKGIDYEHEDLINQINAIYALIDNKSNDDRANKEHVLDSLGDIFGSISAHFALEEQMMKKHSYDHYEEHKADHERLLDDIGDITEFFEKSNQLDEALFKQKMADWFQLHFKTHDSRLHMKANLVTHDELSESAMQTLIQAAKGKLLGRPGR